jgi:alpha-N-acetylglucosamine transferase
MKFVTTRQRPRHHQQASVVLSTLLTGSILGYLLGSSVHTSPSVITNGDLTQDLEDTPLLETTTKTATRDTSATALPSKSSNTNEKEEPNLPLFSTKPNSKFAYVFYVTQPGYYCGAMVNAYQLRKLGTKNNNPTSSPIDIIFLLPDSFQPPADHYATAETLDVKHISVSALPLGTFDNAGSNFATYYADSMVKLSVFSLYEQGYTRIIFLDADSIVLKSLDELFYLPSVSLAAPRAYWIDPGPLLPNCGSATWRLEGGPEVGLQQKFTSALMVVEPTKLLWERLQTKYWPNGQANFSNMYDMDLLNIEFKDDVMLLPGTKILRLSSDWGPEGRMKYRNITGNEEEMDQEVFDSTYVVHFTWGGKVWSLNTEAFERANLVRHPFASKIWDIWWGIAGVESGVLKCAEVGPEGFAPIIIPAGSVFNTIPTV